jgi:hypothetical protein
MEQEGRSMSECVVRMEMPKHCGECELQIWDIWPGSFKCAKTRLDIMSHIRNRTKPNDCPIICQLPEGHGRLVSEKSVRWAIDDIVLEIANRTGRVGMTKDETMEYINNLCTIVPAERSET